jgi:hypothetical protein
MSREFVRRGFKTPSEGSWLPKKPVFLRTRAGQGSVTFVDYEPPAQGGRSVKQRNVLLLVRDWISTSCLADGR